MSHIFSNKAVELFVKGFATCDPESIKPVRPVRVKVAGKYIYTKSGKSLWKTVGHAKSAIKYHFCSAYNSQLEKEVCTGASGYHQRNEIWRDFIKHMEETGVLEFIPA